MEIRFANQIQRLMSRRVQIREAMRMSLLMASVKTAISAQAAKRSETANAYLSRK